MKRKLTSWILLIASIALGSVAGASRQDQGATSCRTRTDVVGKCFKVHGRISVYNGTPSIRLWPIGTKRLLGIIDPNDVSTAPDPTILPNAIKNKLDWDQNVVGDYVVCPLTRPQPGRMQTVCIESGTHLVIQPHKLNGK